MNKDWSAEASAMAARLGQSAAFGVVPVTEGSATVGTAELRPDGVTFEPNVVVNESVPPGTIEFRSQAGALLGSIANVASPPAAENPGAGARLVHGTAAPTVQELRYRQRALLAQCGNARRATGPVTVMLDGPAITVHVPAAVIAEAAQAALTEVEVQLQAMGEEV